jgi:hypothetical protein
MKILHAPTNVGNQPWVLSRYERRHGITSDLVVNYPTWLGYPADFVLSENAKPTLCSMARRLAFGISAPFRYDVLHYYFGRSLLQWDDYGRRNLFPYLDLKLARRLGRKIFMTLQGCDVRLARQSNARNDVTMCRPGGCSIYETCLTSIDAARQTMIDTILPLCDQVFYLNPELANFIGHGMFLPYANVDVETVVPVETRRPGPLRILHAPSNDAIKGSPLIEAAIAELRSEFDFDYIAVRNMPHAEAMALYRDADLVIDQILAGWYGGFAVEVMAMGKPVICYLRQQDLGVLPDAMRRELPILQVDPRRLVEDLRVILSDLGKLPEIGAASRGYVLKWHNPKSIAAAMIEAYRAPDSRFCLEEHV